MPTSHYRDRCADSFALFLVVTVLLMTLPAGTAMASSLLKDLLRNSVHLQTTLANAVENLAPLDGSIVLEFTDSDDSARQRLGETLTFTLGLVDSTAVGVLGDNRIGADAALSGMQSLEQVQTDSVMTLFIGFDTLAPALNQAINLSSNSGTVLGSVTLTADGVLTEVEGISTIAIGSLTSNIVQSANDIQAQLVNNASALKDRLIGPMDLVSKPELEQPV